MKKGFTLIELLAVILILGIIALIAIPTVNKIVSETKLSAFKVSVENTLKAVETQCKLDLLKNIEPNLNYTLYDGEFIDNIEIKGSLPKEGYIILDNNCDVNYYYLVTDNMVDRNTEFIEDQMIESSIKEGESIFKKIYASYYDNIDSISFINNLNIPENAIEINDISVSKNGKVKSWLVENSGLYHLYVGSIDKVYTNYNSSNLFAYNNASTINLDNLYTDYSYDLGLMFAQMKKIEIIDLTKFNIEKAVNLHGMFVFSKKLKTIIGLENLDVSSVRIFRSLFNDTTILASVDLSNWKPRKVIDLHATFHCPQVIQHVDLSNFNVSETEIISTLFYSAHKLETVKFSNWNLPDNVIVNDMIFHSNPYLDYIYLDGATDTTINIIAEALKKSNSIATNKIIYVDEVKDIYPEVPGWTYQTI